MGCCDLQLEEMTMYQTVMKLKNQYRTGKFSERIRCYRCNGILEHEFVKKQFLGFTIRIECPKCGLKHEG
jgi:hypothetical protein